MRRVPLDHPSVDGAVLVRDVRGPAGDVLARAGMVLTARSARALQERGLAVCFIEDPASTGLDTGPVVDLADRDEGAARALRELSQIALREVAPLVQQPTSRALLALKETRFVGAADKSGAMEALRAAAQALVGRMADADPDSGFLTERVPTDDLTGHSVAVAAIAVRIAAELGFTQDDQASTALAALTHDLGLLLVPEEVRRTPARQRTPGHQHRYEDHTLLGEALLRPLERRAPASPIVAAEHHEQQSGAGFPRGLTGGNRVLRKPEGPRITLVSEIVAVADRYERLVSGAPGEPPLSAAVARHAVARDAGTRLNAEVVATFVDLLPKYPTGTEVVLHGAGHEGARAVVVEQGPEPGRPVVRVYATAAGTLPPADLDLARHPSVSLSPVDLPVAA